MEGGGNRAGEVWAVPTAGIGALLECRCAAAVGFGTVELEAAGRASASWRRRLGGGPGWIFQRQRRAGGRRPAHPAGYKSLFVSRRVIDLLG
jgi:hypothetical protein